MNKNSLKNILLCYLKNRIKHFHFVSSIFDKKKKANSISISSFFIIDKLKME